MWLNALTTRDSGRKVWMVSLDEAKGNFIGRPVLEAQKRGGPPRKLAGFEMVGRGIARHGHPCWTRDQEVGAVTSGTYAPFLQKNIGLCYLPAALAAVGTEFDVENRVTSVGGKYYTYDHQGKRVLEQNGQSLKLHLYSITGQKVATYQYTAGSPPTWR